MGTRIATVAACVGALAFGLASHEVAHAAAPKPGGFATISILPSFGPIAEALAVDGAGRIVAGYVRDRSGLLPAVQWTLQGDGSWAFSDLAWPSGASSTIARSVNNNGDVAGNDFPTTASRPLLWPGRVRPPPTPRLST